MKKEIKWSLISICITLSISYYAHYESTQNLKRFQKNMDNTTYFSLNRLSYTFEDSVQNLCKLLLSKGDRTVLNENTDYYMKNLYDSDSDIDFYKIYRVFNFDYHLEDVLDDIKRFLTYYGTDQLPVTKDNERYLKKLIETCSNSHQVLETNLDQLYPDYESIETSNGFEKLNSQLNETLNVDMGSYSIKKTYEKDVPSSTEELRIKEVYPNVTGTEEAIELARQFYKALYDEDIVINYDDDLEDDEFGQQIGYYYDLDALNKYHFYVTQRGSTLIGFDMIEDELDMEFSIFKKLYKPRALTTTILENSLEQAKQILEIQGLFNHEITTYRLYRNNLRFVAYETSPYLNEITKVYVDFNIRKEPTLSRYDAWELYESKLYNYTGYENARDSLDKCKQALETDYLIQKQTLVVKKNRHHKSGVQWIWRFEVPIENAVFNIDVDTVSLAITDINGVKENFQMGQ